MFNKLKVNTAFHYKGIVYIKENQVYLSGKKTLNPISKAYEFIIIASFNKQDQALIDYKERWQIETMFRAMKSSGFNIEDTHLSNLERISKLIALVAIAFIWAYKVGIDKHCNVKEIKIKKHGRRAYSFFKYGLIELVRIFVNNCGLRINRKLIRLLLCT